MIQLVIGDVDGNMHFPLPSMNRLNQTEHAAFYLSEMTDEYSLGKNNIFYRQ
jgi:hypothetical protein